VSQCVAYDTQSSFFGELAKIDVVSTLELGEDAVQIYFNNGVQMQF
jgi:hypothetical protein